jgi:hypothetical protein
VLELIGREYAAEAPTSLVRRKFAKYKATFNEDFLRDMRELGMLSDESELTQKGLRAIRAIARSAK